ncbi:hypothetical protein [Nocardia sp. X0981]
MKALVGYAPVSACECGGCFSSGGSARLVTTREFAFDGGKGYSRRRTRNSAMS